MKTIIKKIISLLPVKRRILLESHPDLSGNTFQVYEEILNQGLNEKYEIVWLVENPDQYKNIKIKNVTFKHFNPTSKFGVIKMLLYKATTKMFIYENKIISKINKKTISVFLNHGTLLKNTKGMYGPEENVDYVISASEKINHLYAEMYGISEKIVQPLGYPRNDLLFNSSKIDWKVFFPEYKHEKIVIWMPTFRQHKSGTRKDTITELPLGIPVIY
ncbi:MAG: CDP-glycerol glycerophosphotransferase family protein, partial [Lysinibacillus sp.]